MDDYSSFHKKLHSWYGKHGRKDLPWRNTDDAYAIYVSEVMLQQTQVKTVLERYYFQFLKRFPTLKALAKAKEQDVLSAWQGLGYYSRARNLYKAAKACGGQLPRDVDALIALPGIGRNTAHAVASFAYHQPVAVMEANVKRVLCRIFALESPTDAELWNNATALLDIRNPFDYNQAMMDIGAQVCSKRNPKCSKCPAETICAGQSTPEQFPAKKLKKVVPVRQKIIVIKQNGKGEYFATPRTTQFLNGLYHFEEHPLPPDVGGVYLGAIRQQYSHFTLEANVYRLRVAKSSGKGWYSLAKLKKLPFSMAEKKILEMLS
ncbi:MAG: A/G-specific adenine glycosylase [Alphaproteobacteria bacterium]